MEVVVPDLGDFADVEVIEVLVKPGDAVTAEQGLITLETEKATMDIPSPAAGRIRELKVKAGDRVSAGSVIALLDTEAPAVDTRPEEDRTVLQPKLAKAAAAAAAPPAAAAPRSVVVPDLGDFADVEIIDVLVKAGDEVAAEQGLVTLETEKASMDVPAPEAGRILEVKVAVGGKVSAGDVLVSMQPSAATPVAGAPAPPAAATAAPTRAPAPPRPAAARAAPSSRSAVSSSPTSFSEAHAGPSVRKLARELGVDLGRVRGSGAKGRVTADDVKAFVKDIMQGGGARRRGVARRAECRFREIRPRRDAAAVAHPEDFGSAFARELGQHPARHAAR